ncbi:hypothetical protein HAX54_018340 [Datura stramonium]|uniref:Uncharacterized protein n=1 Tax=Datura stramonium TaxID=4076 RepID=A0ABS8UMV2_DATST|nr:hypothetical protein [Datura stramonium]
MSIDSDRIHYESQYRSFHHGTMTIKKRAIKNSQEKRARVEIAGKRSLLDETSASKKEKNTLSGSLEEYQVDTDDTDEPRTTKKKAKAQNVATSATPKDAPQSKEEAEVQLQGSGSGSN